MLRKLTPRFLEKVWGSEHLEPWFSNKHLSNTGGKIGEVWFEGPTDFPLLVKFLFTSEPLSVQVHPNDTYAAKHHDSRGKTEMWHILAAQPGAKIAAGFRESISLERLRAAALSGEIEDLLSWPEARPGDTFFIPAGTVHAIGAGLTLCEIQQHSDVTYRLYDYGRPRELHLDHALAVSKREPHAARVDPQRTPLVSCEYFTMARHECSGTLTVPHTPDLVIVIDGAGNVGGQGVRAGEVWHATPGTKPVEVTGRVTILAVSICQPTER